MPIQTPQNNEQLRADLLGGTGQFAGYSAISGDEYTGNEEAWQGASSSGVQEYNGTLYGVRPDSLAIEGNVPPEGETINPDESTEQATGGYRDTFAEDALAALNGDQAALNQFRIQTIENQRLENESRMTELQLQSDADAKSINTWTNDNTDKRVEDFKEEIDYKSVIDNLNKIELAMADQWKLYQDSVNNIRRNPNILSSQSAGIQGQYKEDYLAEATFLGMQADIAQGYVDRADKRVERYYTQVSDMRTQMISNFEKAKSLKDQNIFQLSLKEEEYINDTIDVMKDQQIINTAEKESKKQLWQFAMQNGVDPSSIGLSLKDDYNTMLSKLSPAIKAQGDAEFNRIHSGDGTDAGSDKLVYPEHYKSEVQKFAYATARNWVATEGAGFTNWEEKIAALQENFGKLSPGMTTEEIDVLMKDAMYQYKELNDIKQLDFNKKGGGGITIPDIVAPEGISTGKGFFENVWDAIKPSEASLMSNEEKERVTAERNQQKLVELQQYVNAVENKENPSEAELRGKRKAETLISSLRFMGVQSIEEGIIPAYEPIGDWFTN